MRADKALPMLVYTDAGITIISIAVNRALGEFLPAPLLGYVEQEASALRSAGDFLLTGMWVAVNAATLLAWVGLLNLWRPARAIYFWTWVSALLLLPLDSVWLFSSVGYMLDTTASLVGGALLGVLYFSDARTHFERAACAPRAGEAKA